MMVSFGCPCVCIGTLPLLRLLQATSRRQEQLASEELKRDGRGRSNACYANHGSWSTYAVVLTNMGRHTAAGRSATTSSSTPRPSWLGRLSRVRQRPCREPWLLQPPSAKPRLFNFCSFCGKQREVNGKFCSCPRVNHKTSMITTTTRGLLLDKPCSAYRWPVRRSLKARRW